MGTTDNNRSLASQIKDMGTSAVGHRFSTSFDIPDNALLSKGLDLRCKSVTIPTKFVDTITIVFFETEDLYIKKLIRLLDNPLMSFGLKIYDLSHNNEVLIEYDLINVKYHSHTTSVRDSSSPCVVQYTVCFSFSLFSEDLKR